MTSLHSQLWSQMGFPVLQDNNGETVLYTPISNGARGTPLTFTAPFAEKDGGQFDRSINREKVTRLATVECPTTVLVDDSPQTPSYGPDDTFEILGTLWKVDKFGSRDAAQVTIHLLATGSDLKLTRAGRR